MENAIKTRLNVEELRLLAGRVFGEELQEWEELMDGWANTAYRIRLGSGKQTALKVGPPPGTILMRYEAELMRTEVEAMRLASGVVPVPKVLWYDTERRLIGSDYFFMEWLDGVPYK